jgi:CHAT domain-containing protein
MAREAQETGVTTKLSHAPLLICMPTTPGCKPLYHAEREVKAVGESLAPALASAAVILHKPNKAAVIQALQNGTTIMHFAGHGRSDPADPLESALLVQDWKQDPLTVKDLLALKLHERKQNGGAEVFSRAPFLAYLSACSTGSNKVDDLLDEGLHLMSACQLSGFRHVVGSLWAVSDRHCVDVARSVFERLNPAFESEGADAAVTLGLQEGIKRLRSEGVVGGTRDSDTFTGNMLEGDSEDDAGETSDGPDRAGAQSRETEKVLGEGDRDGYGESEDNSEQSWDGADPRLWAAYIHIGP